MLAPTPRPPRRVAIARVTLAGALLVLALWITAGFLPAIAWAVVLAIAIDPLFMRWRAQAWSRGGTTIPALAITLAIALLILVPLIAGITQAAREAHDLVTWAVQAQANGVPVPEWVARLPFGADSVGHWWQDNLATPEAATQQFHTMQRAGWLSHTRLIGTNVLRRLVVLAFTLLSLFFVLRDRDTILAQIRLAADRLLGPAGDRVGRQAVLSVRGTIDGLVLVGIGEGAVMAVVYLVLGVPHPLLLGALTAVAAMIPFGAALVFAVAALLLLGQGAVGAAIAVVVIGLVVVGIADHFIRPVLIGGATRLPFLWVLIGILGGVEALGLLGLFVGPATMAVLIMLWREFLEGAAAERGGVVVGDRP